MSSKLFRTRKLVFNIDKESCLHEICGDMVMGTLLKLCSELHYIAYTVQVLYMFYLAVDFSDFTSEENFL